MGQQGDAGGGVQLQSSSFEPELKLLSASHLRSIHTKCFQHIDLDVLYYMHYSLFFNKVNCCLNCYSIWLLSAQIMEKPCILANTHGLKGIYECFKPCIEKHFTIIQYEEYFERREHFAGMIQAIFVWNVSLKVNKELLQALPKLKVVVNGGVGVDHLDIRLINSFGVKVCNTPHIVDNATADIGIALMLASARRIIEGEDISYC